MKILELKVENYRNLDKLEVSFDGECNFLVGENNLGKSNLLALLNSICNSRSFKADDFAAGNPIKVELRVGLAPIEIGQFEDLFELDEPSTIRIIAEQADADEFLAFSHKASGTSIPMSAIRALNFIHYDSLRNPAQEITFDKGRGAGRFLSKMVARHLEVNELTNEVFVDEARIGEIVNSVNSTISKIKSFRDFGVLAMSDPNAEDLLCNLLKLRDTDGNDLLRAGYGIQFLILVALSVLEKIQAIYDQRGDRSIFTDDVTGRRSVSLVLGIDEPEIHLHPYMQRALVKYLEAMVTNQNADFNGLVKDLFDIDEVHGQVFVATHSPNIILNKYEQIVRLYREAGALKAVSGATINLNDQLSKHLALQFPFVKEAFFSRSVIFVEGDTEYGALPGFAKSMGMDFDDLGISVISANGDNVALLMVLAEKFGIPSVGITDLDNGQRQIEHANHFQTAERDFEAEMVALIQIGREATLHSILNAFDSLGENREMEKEALNKRAVRKYAMVAQDFAAGLRLVDIQSNDTVSKKCYYVTWFDLNKSRPLGLLVGRTLGVDEIPSVYRTALEKARDLSLNV